MVILYNTPGCLTGKKIRNLIKERNLTMREKNLYKVLLDDKETADFLALMEANDMLTSINKYQCKIDREFLQENPIIVPRPLVFDEEGKLINDLVFSCDKKCPHYQTCGKLRSKL